MAEFVEDNIVYPTMISLSACLCAQFEHLGLPQPCSCGPMVGELVIDYCSNCADGKCGGQAWVRLVNVFPSIDFPQPSQTLNTCAMPLAYQLEVGVVRCKPVGSTSGARGFTPPTLEQQVGALRLQTADIQAMLRAINCCFDDTNMDFIVGQYNPVTPEGDCLGGAFTLWVRGPY